MNKKYKVRALFQETQRRRTITFIARNEEDAIDLLKNSGFTEPFEIEEEQCEPPTEAQLEYIKDLNITIPADATKEDAAAIINKRTGSDPRPDLIEYAYDKGLFVSKYIGKKELYNFIFNNLSPEDRIAFFCFSVYRWLSEDRQSNLHRHKYKAAIYEFAKQQLNNEKFLKSLIKYDGSDLRFFGTLRFSDGGQAQGGSTNTNAYKACAEFLNVKFGIQNAEIKTIDSGTRKIVDTPKHQAIDNRVTRSAKGSNQGCFGILLLLAAFVLVIAFAMRL